MRSIIVAHQDETLKGYIEKISNQTVAKHTIITQGKSVFEVASLINDQLKDSQNTLLLSLEATIGNSKPNELKAAELIYHLRATHQLTNPIVVVAMQTLSSILRQQPELTVLNAQGVYFTDVLSDYSFLGKIKKYYDRYAVKDLKKDYLRHFKNKLNVAQVRHEQANIYALKQLVKIHKVVTGFDVNTNYAGSKDDLDFLLADFVFGSNEKEYSEKFNNNKFSDDDYLQKIKDKNIYVIDDQSKMWLPFYKAQLKGANVVDFDFDASDFDTNNNIGEDDWNALKEELNEDKDWIILLDLRINPNEDNDRPIESISGILLLQRINKHFPYIPVIITTASNKSKTLAKLASMKVDGYWVKEGIDNGWTAQESLENYFKLSYLVAKASKETFTTLKDFYGISSNLKQNEFWFNAKSNTLIPDYADDKFYENTILDMQNNLFTIFKRHCKDFIMNFNYSQKNDFEKEEQLSIAGLLNGIGSFTEILLGYNILENKTKAYSSYKDNIDFKLLDETNYKRKKIEKLRNNASHAQLAKFSTYENLTNMINLLTELIKSTDVVKNQVSYYNDYIINNNKVDLIFDRSWSPHYCKIVSQKDKSIVGIINEGHVKKVSSKELIPGTNRRGLETVRINSGDQEENYNIFCPRPQK